MSLAKLNQSVHIYFRNYHKYFFCTDLKRHTHNNLLNQNYNILLDLESSGILVFIASIDLGVKTTLIFSCDSKAVGNIALEAAVFLS